MSAPNLCVVTEEPCLKCGHTLHSTNPRVGGCNGDGTRTVHTPAPERSVLLTGEQADAVRCWLTTTTSGRHLVLLRSTGYPVDPDLSAALDALGVGP